MVDQTVSPDGRYVAGTRQRDVWLVSVADASSRILFTAEAPIFGYTLQWSSDTRAVFVTAPDASRRRDVWRIPLQGPPVKLELGLEHIADDGLSIHPDGKRVAVQDGAPAASEIRVLEAVFPVAKR